MVTNFLNFLSLCYMEPRPDLTWPSNEPFPFQSINWDGLVPCWLVECLNCQSYVSEIRNSYDWISYSLKPNPLPLPFLMNCKFFKWKSRSLFLPEEISLEYTCKWISNSWKRIYKFCWWFGNGVISEDIYGEPGWMDEGKMVQMDFPRSFTTYFLKMVQMDFLATSQHMSNFNWLP